MEECLPKMTKSKRALRSSDDRATAASKEAELAQTLFTNSKQEEDKKALERSSSQTVLNLQAGGGRRDMDPVTEH
jgi:hypothetical protein